MEKVYLRVLGVSSVSMISLILHPCSSAAYCFLHLSEEYRPTDEIWDLHTKHVGTLDINVPSHCVGCLSARAKAV
jgi:hypothetical protein